MRIARAETWILSPEIALFSGEFKLNISYSILIILFFVLYKLGLIYCPLRFMCENSLNV